VVVNSKGEKLKTEHLIWDRRKRRIYSNVYTQIIKPNRILEGNSFESNETFTEYKITKLKGDIEINNE
jgi:capsular polysaccharide biosynthesis protein